MTDAAPIPAIGSANGVTLVRVVDVPRDGAATTSDGVAQANPPAEDLLRWIDVEAQDAATLELLQQRFGLHPLAIEDCLHFDQRPKLEEYQNGAFIVFHALECPRGDPRETIARELHVFLGEGYLITVHDVPLPALENVRRRIVGDPSLARRGSDFLLYLLADTIVDAHFVHLDAIAEALEALEERVLAHPAQADLEHMLELKHTLLVLRKVLSPQRDVFAILAKRGAGALVSERTALYIRDVYDHLVRIAEAIDTARELLASTLEAYRSMVAQRTNEIMKSLTLLSAVFLPLTFVTGFFGQNFEHLPFRSDLMMWSMVVICGGIPIVMLAWFKTKKWL